MEKENRYLVVEGPIGVGKTSLAKILSEELGLRLELEVVEKNPFLKKFYADPKRYAFETQTFFLLSRFRQQMELSQGELFSQGLAADYFFQKDRIFAYLNLNEDELKLYERLQPILATRLAVPDLVIYLQAETAVLMERIKERKFDFEKGVERSYVDEVNRAYSRFFFNYQDSPLLIINTNEIDFVNNKKDLDNLIVQIRTMKAGMRFYSQTK